MDFLMSQERPRWFQSQDLTVALQEFVRETPQNLRKKEVSAGQGRQSFGRALLHQPLYPSHRNLLCTHCPPAGGWTAGLDGGVLGPGCHSGSGSTSGHSGEPVGRRGELKEGARLASVFYSLARGFLFPL